MFRHLPALIAAAFVLASGRPAAAGAQGVGLGVAAGVDVYRASPEEGDSTDREAGFAWGFFVDIPLLETFYITPATTLYDLDFGTGKVSVTDVDLNFKFIVPLGTARLGGGVTAGLTSGLDEDYYGHYGLLGYFSVNVAGNLEGFALLQYKRIPFQGGSIENTHAFVGGMFVF